MSLSKRVFILILFTMVYSCSQDDELTGEFPEPAISIVQGAVTSDGKQPVDSVHVTVFHKPNGCETDGSLEPSETITNSEGEFEIKFQIRTIRSDKTCYLIEAIPSDTTKFKVPNVKNIDPEFSKEPPYDTVRVYFTLDSKK